MATDILAGDAIELPAAVVAAIAAELPAPAGGSALDALLGAAGATAADWQQPLAQRGLVEDGELAPWLARSLSVLMWPGALVRTRDTVASAPATHFVAADTLVRYGQAAGVCLIGHPTHRDVFVDQLVGLCTSTVHRPGDPPVLALSRWTLQAIETVLGGERTRTAARAALAALTSAPDGPDLIIAALIDDDLVAEAGDALVPGPALDGWSDALDSRLRLELQRLDMTDGSNPANVRTMLFTGTPGDRCLLMPLGGDEMLLVKPTIDEATALIDAFLTPAPPAQEPDPFEAITAAWRASAEALIASGSR